MLSPHSRTGVRGDAAASFTFSGYANRDLLVSARDYRLERCLAVGDWHSWAVSDFFVVLITVGVQGPQRAVSGRYARSNGHQ